MLNRVMLQMDLQFWPLGRLPGVVRDLEKTSFSTMPGGPLAQDAYAPVGVEEWRPAEGSHSSTPFAPGLAGGLGVWFLPSHWSNVSTPPGLSWCARHAAGLAFSLSFMRPHHMS